MHLETEPQRIMVFAYACGPGIGIGLRSTGSMSLGFTGAHMGAPSSEIFGRPMLEMSSCVCV